MVVVAISILIFSATASVLAGLHAAPSSFTSADTYTVVSSTAPTIFSSQLDAQMVSVLDSAPNVTGTSPEVFAFSSWNGVSFVLRGADIHSLNSTGPEFEEFEISGTHSLDERSSALAGTRLLERLGVELPFTMPVVGSYASRMDFINIVGYYKTDTALDDEMIVSLDMARFLSGMPSDKVSIIRVATSDPDWLSQALSPTEARFALYDLLSPKSTIAVSQEVELTVSVKNWGSSAGETVVSFYYDGLLESNETVSLDPGQSKLLKSTFASDVIGIHTVTASMGGEFPTDLSVNITVSSPYLSLSAPSQVALNEPFNATVSDYLGRLMESATVVFGTQSELTDENGTASFVPLELGPAQIHAELSGYLPAYRTVEVFDPSSFPDEFSPSVTSFVLDPDAIKQNESAHGTFVIENNGTLPGTSIVLVSVDSSSQLQIVVPLQGLERRTVYFTLANLDVGTHIVQVGTFSEELVVQSWIVDNPDFVELVLRYGGVSDLVPSGTIPIYEAAKVTEGNISVVLFALGAVSGVLAALAMVSVFSKEIHEGRRRLGIMRTLGASRADIRKLVFPQALEFGLAGAALGTAGGVIVAELLSGSGEILLFGHQLDIQLSASLLLLILVGAVAISLGSALATAMVAAGESAIASIKKLPPQEPEPVDMTALAED